MKETTSSYTDTTLRTCAIVVLIACLLLAGRNTQPNNEKPQRSPVQSTKDHSLRVGNA